MAILADSDRLDISADFQSNRATGMFGNLTKNDIKAAVDALDDFLNDNAATINAALPQPARSQLTTPQKALLLQYVIQKRYIRGS